MENSVINGQSLWKNLTTPERLGQSYKVTGQAFMSIIFRMKVIQAKWILSLFSLVTYDCYMVGDKIELSISTR